MMPWPDGQGLRAAAAAAAAGRRPRPPASELPAPSESLMSDSEHAPRGRPSSRRGAGRRRGAAVKGRAPAARLRWRSALDGRRGERGDGGRGEECWGGGGEGQDHGESTPPTSAAARRCMPESSTRSAPPAVPMKTKPMAMSTCRPHAPGPYRHWWSGPARVRASHTDTAGPCRTHTAAAAAAAAAAGQRLGGGKLAAVKWLRLRLRGGEPQMWYAGGFSRERWISLAGIVRCRFRACDYSPAAALAGAGGSRAHGHAH